MQPSAVRALRQDHQDLDRLREIADALDDATPERAVVLVAEANSLVVQQIAEHERDDESQVYPRLAKILHQSYGLAAMSCAIAKYSTWRAF